MSPPSFFAFFFFFFFFFLQNLRFLHLFFLLSGEEGGDGACAGADVDASSLPRTPRAASDGAPQHAPALRRSFLPLLHLLAADESIPIAGSTREGGGTLGSIRAGRVAGFLGDTSTSTRPGTCGRESCSFVPFLEVRSGLGEAARHEPDLANALRCPYR